MTRMICGGCDSTMEVVTFPALQVTSPRQVSPEARLDESEGGCFFHPQSKAHLPCEVCGRFLCSLCDLEVQGIHLCPACLESGRHRQNLEILVHKRFIPDRAAMILCIYPLLFSPLLIFTAPVSLYFAVRGLGPARSLVPDGQRRRAVIASIIAVLEIVLVVVGLSTLLS